MKSCLRKKREFKWDGIHPLHVPNVIRNMLKFLPENEIETCRRVCSSWRQESGIFLRRKPIIVYLNGYNYISKYIKYMSGIMDLPHSQFLFSNITFKLKSETLTLFFYSFGDYITSLHLFLQVEWSDLYLILTKYTKNLKYLKLGLLPRDDDYTTTFKEELPLRLCPTLKCVKFSMKAFIKENISSLHLKGLNKLFDCGLNIECLGLRVLDSSYADTYLRNFRFRRAEQFLIHEILHSSPNQLTKLQETGIVWTEQNLNSLIEKKFPFRSVHIINDDNSWSAGIRLKKYFSTTESTLTNLSYTNCCASESIAFDGYCQYLKNITTLTLLSFSGSLSFIVKLPALETLALLEIDFQKISIPEKGFQSSTTHHNLKCLKISPPTTGQITIGSHIMKSVVICFPLLRFLHLNKLTDAGISIIFRHLCNLEELAVHESFLSDAGISGIPVDMLLEEFTTLNLFKQIESSREQISTLENRPSIGNLRNLKRLVIEVPETEDGKISNSIVGDIGVIFGVAECTGLVELCLENWLLTDISLMIIARNLRGALTKLDLSHCQQITDEGRLYLKKHFIGPHLIL